MIDFHFIETKNMPLEKFVDWLEHVIVTEKKKTGDIVFVFCNDDYLLKKNMHFLKHTTLTDVITFDYSIGKKVSGDILISVERIKENSKTFNVSFLNELNRVMVHGLLHLLGYNDKTKQEAKLMKSKEDFYLAIR